MMINGRIGTVRLVIGGAPEPLYDAIWDNRRMDTDWHREASRLINTEIASADGRDRFRRWLEGRCDRLLEGRGAANLVMLRGDIREQVLAIGPNGPMECPVRDAPIMSYGVAPRIRAAEARTRSGFIINRLLAKVREAIDRRVTADIISLISMVSGRSESTVLGSAFGGTIASHPHDYRGLREHGASTMPLENTLSRNGLRVMLSPLVPQGHPHHLPLGTGTGIASFVGGTVRDASDPGNGYIGWEVHVRLRIGIRLDCGATVVVL